MYVSWLFFSLRDGCVGWFANVWNRALAMIILIGRSKLVLDFAVSLHVVHLVVVTLYTGALPSNTAWWATMACATGVGVALATWGCQYRELRPIAFGGSSSAANNNNAGGGVSDNGARRLSGDGDGDEEEGFSRGRGRGRGRDGAGEYEMVTLPGKMNGAAGETDR